MVNFTPKLRPVSNEQRSIKIEEIVNKHFQYVYPETPMSEAISLILANKITSIVVVDSSMKLQGILSEKDCLELALDAKYYNQMPGQVRDYMTSDVITLRPNDHFLDAISTFTEKKVRVVPIIDGGQKVIGVLARHTALLTLNNYLQATWRPKKQQAANFPL